MIKQRRVFSAEFKREAVDTVLKHRLEMSMVPGAVQGAPN